ncbi:MAG TPA: D-xylose ABC transporter substrate-binding protein, partial [Cyanobacteria bacterium UBA8530]|nr:D-xylose ABC transporter substrate-binding protein [Cyanobacteria bacterium UBA8530]
KRMSGKGKWEEGMIVGMSGEGVAPISNLTIAKAHEAKIKVISYDRLIRNAPVDLYLSFDPVGVGRLQAQSIVKLVARGNYALIEGADTDNNAFLLKKGQMEVLKPLIDKGDIKVVYEQWSKDWKPEEAMRNMENALTANGNKIDAVIAANDGTAGGVIQALAAQGMDGKIPVSGQDAELAACQRIAEGKQAMTIYKPLKKLADRAAEAALSFAKGEKITTTEKVNNGKEDIPSILLSPLAVDKNNLLETVVKDGYQKKEAVFKKNKS